MYYSKDIPPLCVRTALTLLLITCLAWSPVPWAQADGLTPTGVSCSYSDSEDCAGVVLVTETCTTRYSNGSTSISMRTYMPGWECWMCTFLLQTCGQY